MALYVTTTYPNLEYRNSLFFPPPVSLPHAPSSANLSMYSVYTPASLRRHKYVCTQYII